MDQVIEADTNLVWAFVQKFILGLYLVCFLTVIMGSFGFIFLILRDIYRSNSIKPMMSEKTKKFGTKIVIGAVIVAVFDYLISMLGIRP